MSNTERFSNEADYIIDYLYTGGFITTVEYEALINAANRLEKYEDTDLEPEEIIDRKVPKIDPVHYAGGCYCRECRFRTDSNNCRHPRYEILPTVYPNDFCSYGRRRGARSDGVF